MSVVSIHGRDAEAEARALLNFMLQRRRHSGTDHAGRTVIQIAVDPWTLDQLLNFDAAPKTSRMRTASPSPMRS